MASYAGLDGTAIRPGMEALIADTGLAERQLRRHITLLRESGWLVIVAVGSNFGRSAKASEYRLSYPAEVTSGPGITGHP